MGSDWSVRGQPLTASRTSTTSVALWLLHWTLLTSGTQIPPQELDGAYWRDMARAELLHAEQSARRVEGVAKNVILFIGDGMSLSTVTASRIHKGQLKGKPGEEETLAFERLPNVALAKTYNVDHQVADSAATATAYLCGVKAHYGTLGVGPRVQRGNCQASLHNNVTCIAEAAQRAGKRTGIVTSSRLSHATPAPLYAFSSDRMWETDSSLPESARQQGCTDIASQLAGPVGRNINVLFGGGRKTMLPASEPDPEYASKRGERQDGRNVVEEWLADKDADRARYVWNKQQFDDLDVSNTDHVIGLFEHSHMKFDGDRHRDKAGEPSLREMVTMAIRLLDKGPHGYFLLVEGARIDHAHHENTARRALEETIALDDAVASALDMVDTQDTLVIVTADHSHPLAIGSYATRGNPILGLTDYGDEDPKTHLSSLDNKPYTTLSYANGPGFDDQRPRTNLTGAETTGRHYKQATAVPTKIVSHDGTDVPIYSAGPMSHLLHSTHEQHYIYHVMAYAACLEHYAFHGHCTSPQAPASVVSRANTVTASSRNVAMLLAGLVYTLSTIHQS